MQTDEPLHSFPCPLAATTLTPPTDHRQPEPSDLVNEATQAVTVARDGVIVQPALHDTPQMFQQHRCSPTSQVLRTHLPASPHREANSTRAVGDHVSLSV